MIACCILRKGLYETIVLVSTSNHTLITVLTVPSDYAEAVLRPAVVLCCKRLLTS